MNGFNRMLTTCPRCSDALSLLTGLLLPFTFAPYHFYLLVFPLIALFAISLTQATLRQVFWRGWLFGFGQFVWGISWIYHSVHTYGQAPAALAIAMIILLAAYCALFPALAAWLAKRFFAVSLQWFLLVGLPLMWVVTEWLRGYLFTGFPWLALGVSQTDTVLSGYAPLVGALGVAGIVVLLSGLLLLLLYQREQWKIYLPVMLALFLSGLLLQQVNWSEKTAKPIKVSIAQLSITQDQKWLLERRNESLQWYLQQTRVHSDSDLVIWPETAIPSFMHRVENFWSFVKKQAETAGNETVAGVFIKNQDNGRYYNSIVSTNGDFYQKRHLVPLGEYMPFRSLFEFMNQYVKIPMSDIAEGPDDQQLMRVAGHKAGASICFEDVFDREIRKALPEAELLINISNDAWFKTSPEPYQHHQIARMRSIETSRYMIRSTNTGVSSIIDEKGREVVTTGLYERLTVTGEVSPMKGATPYVLLGNFPLILLAVAMLGWRIYGARQVK